MYLKDNSKYSVSRSRKKDIYFKNNIRIFLMRSLSTIIKGILAGIMISLGCVAYLSTDNRYLGSLLFAISIFAVLSYGFELYTARVGYAPVQSVRKNLQLIPAWIGNLLGALLSGFLLGFTDIAAKLSSRALSICKNNINGSVYSALLLSVFCGILIFIAVDNFKNAANNVQKYLAMLLATTVFMLCGFEHSVSNMFYLTVAHKWSIGALGYIIVMTFGNSLGAMIIPVCYQGIGAIKKLTKRNN